MMGQQSSGLGDPNAAAQSVMPSDMLMGGAVPSSFDSTSDPNASAASGEHPAATNLKSNMSFMQKLMGLLGDTQEEREKNAGALNAMVSDLGSVMKNAGESSLMRRMMTHQMRPMAVVSSNAPAGGVGQIPPDIMAPIMAQMGFK
jgi:hypothetical protein